MIYFVAFIFACTFLLTAWYRRYAISKKILDIPNQRSSHLLPVPRGGGLAFVFGFLITMPVLMYLGWLPITVFWAYIASSLLVAGLGLIDDFTKIRAKWRLLGHLLAAAVVLHCFKGMPEIVIGHWAIPKSYLLNFLGVIYLVWLINLYNFMDGIDGLAGVEAVSVSLAIAALYWISNLQYHMVLPLVLAAAVSGFLLWNFPKARIFMGDAGSGFLGLVFGIMSLQAAGADSTFFWGLLILLGVFIVDSTTTLLRRLFQGDKIHQPHRNHAYQHASRRFNNHYSVTLAVLALNVFWLFPIAVLVVKGCFEGFWGLIVAYIPLIIIAIKFKAGKISAF